MSNLFSEHLDLLGDPIPANHGGKGRPCHVPTDENRLKIMGMLAFGWTQKRIADVIGISVPTMREHYSSILKARKVAADKTKVARMMQLMALAQSGNVAAIKQLEAMEQGEIKAGIAATYSDQKPKAKKPKLGKKEQANQDAGDAWSDIINMGSVN